MEMELCVISKDLERFKNELLYNQRLLKNTEENIEFLKETGVIVSLSEYKKIIQQHKLIKTRVEYYGSKVSPLEIKIARKEVYLEEELKKFEEVYRLQFENNILEFPNVSRKNKKN